MVGTEAVSQEAPRGAIAQAIGCYVTGALIDVAPIRGEKP